MPNLLPPLTVSGNYEISSISHLTMSPTRPNNVSSMYPCLPLSKNSYSVISAFCTEDNIPQCISYINQVQKYNIWCDCAQTSKFAGWKALNYSCHLCTTCLILYRSSSASFPLQELSSLGLSSPCIGAASPGRPGLNTVSALNAVYELLQIHRRSMCTLEELEKEHLKKSSSLEHMQTNNSRLKARMRSSGTEQLQTPCNFKGQWSIAYRHGATNWHSDFSLNRKSKD